MGGTKTNDIKLSFAVEESLGVLPTTPVWTEVDRTSVDSFGASITKTEITPINQNAMNEKAIVTDLESTVGYGNNLTISALFAHIQGLFRSEVQEQANAVPTSVVNSTSSFEHAALSSAIAENTLIYARNFTNTDNDGLHVVGASSTTTSTITTSTLVNETSIPENARFNVVGYQGTSGDIELDSDNNLISTTLDFTTLGLTVGQPLWIGGATTATTFDTADYTGLVRIKIIETNKITIEERPWTVGAADDGAGKTIQLFFGDFIRNVPRNHTDYVTESYMFEGAFTDMGTSGTDTYYEYPAGNRVSECALAFPVSGVATISWTFVGTDTPNMTTTQATGTRASLYNNKGFGTSSDCVFLKVKDSDLLDYDTTFTDLNLSFSNGIAGRKALCNLGNMDLNDGNFSVSGSVSTFMTDANMINAVRNNATLVLSYAISNDDGVLDFYIPSMTLSSKNYDMAENDNNIVSYDIMTDRDAFYNFIMGVSLFHYLPI